MLWGNTIAALVSAIFVFLLIRMWIIREDDAYHVLGHRRERARLVEPAGGRLDRADLHMSVATAKAHVSRLLSKLEVDNRVQIALLVQDGERA